MIANATHRLPSEVFAYYEPEGATPLFNDPDLRQKFDFGIFAAFDEFQQGKLAEEKRKEDARSRLKGRVRGHTGGR